VHQVCGQCSGWRLRCAAIGLGSVLDACPERRLVYIQLIFEDVAPYAWAVGVPVHRVGDPAPLCYTWWKPIGTRSLN